MASSIKPCGLYAVILSPEEESLIRRMVERRSSRTKEEVDEVVRLVVRDFEEATSVWMREERQFLENKFAIPDPPLKASLAILEIYDNLYEFRPSDYGEKNTPSLVSISHFLRQAIRLVLGKQDGEVERRHRDIPMVEVERVLRESVPKKFYDPFLVITDGSGRVVTVEEMIVTILEEYENTPKDLKRNHSEAFPENVDLLSGEFYLPIRHVKKGRVDFGF